MLKEEIKYIKWWLKLVSRTWLLEECSTEERNLAVLELTSRPVTFQKSDTLVFTVFHSTGFVNTNRLYKNRIGYSPRKKSDWELSALRLWDPFIHTCLWQFSSVWIGDTIHWDKKYGRKNNLGENDDEFHFVDVTFEISIEHPSYLVSVIG